MINDSIEDSDDIIDIDLTFPRLPYISRPTQQRLPLSPNVLPLIRLVPLFSTHINNQSIAVAIVH